MAASTRTAGFSSVNVAALHPAVQVSYMIMMYISVFPIAISIRRTNMYEERSLGIHEAVDDAENDQDVDKLNTASYMGNHLRRQLSFDLWYVFAGMFILSISEAGKITAGEISLFGILFEVISAYGTVGLSFGFPGLNASMSGGFSVLGKLVIILMQIRGRHRGLPYGLDRAIMLPSEEHIQEEIEKPGALARIATGFSTGTSLRQGATLRNQATSATHSDKDIGMGGLKRMPTMANIKAAGAGIGKTVTRSMTSMLVPGPPPRRRPRSSGAATVGTRSFDRGALSDDDSTPVSPRGTRN
jgi:hypothetical protein